MIALAAISADYYFFKCVQVNHIFINFFKLLIYSVFSAFFGVKFCFNYTDLTCLLEIIVLIQQAKECSDTKVCIMILKYGLTLKPGPLQILKQIIFYFEIQNKVFCLITDFL